MGVENLTQAERFFSRTPPGHEYLPLLLVALLLVAALVQNRGRR